MFKTYNNTNIFFNNKFRRKRMSRKMAYYTARKFARELSRNTSKKSQSKKNYYSHEANEVLRNYENYMKIALSFHQDCSDEVDWNIILKSPAPIRPENKNFYEKEAKKILESYNPTFFDKIFGNEEKKKSKLIKAIEDAKINDKKQFENKLKQYEEKKEERDISIQAAKNVLNLEHDALLKTINENKLFADISDLGRSINLNITDKNNIVITLNAQNDDFIIPSKPYRTNSGKISVKQLSETERMALYKKHICSATLRIAREIFALLPVESVYVNAITEILNTQTGIIEDIPILSVEYKRSVLKNLDFDLLDPSDSLSNFSHKINYLSRKGFQKIELLKVP